MAKKVGKYIREVDLGFNRLRNSIRRVDGLSVKVGYFETAHVEAGGKPSGLTMAHLAAIHETGFAPRNIPARPWMKPTVIGKQKILDAHRARLMKEALEGKRTFESALFEWGQIVAGEMVLTLKSHKTPKLKDKTIENKGSSKLLIDTGALMGHTTARMFVRGARVK